MLGADAAAKKKQQNKLTVEFVTVEVAVTVRPTGNGSAIE